jgi:hypothetical protein
MPGYNSRRSKADVHSGAAAISPMRRSVGLRFTLGVFGIWAGVAGFLDASPAIAGAPPRVRGTIIAVAARTITVRQQDGKVLTLKTGPDTLYADVVPANLRAIKPSDFVGTASKGPPGRWVAVEIVIIPQSLQAGRKGYASWDPLPDPSGARPAMVAATSMTNGVVSRVSTMPVERANTSMTNGRVTASKSATAGRVLAVTLVGGKKATIFVPANAPVVRFVRAKRSTVAIGSVAFIKTNPGDRAGLVAVGKGVSPPM